MRVLCTMGGGGANALAHQVPATSAAYLNLSSTPWLRGNLGLAWPSLAWRQVTSPASHGCTTGGKRSPSPHTHTHFLQGS